MIKIKIYNSNTINKPIQSIKSSTRSREILNFNNFMYKSDKDAINIEKAKEYNSSIKTKSTNISQLSIKEINNPKPILQSDNDMTDSYYNVLFLKSQLKKISKSFINIHKINITNYMNQLNSYLINSTCPEILLQESFLNSQLISSPIISRRESDDVE